VTKSVPEIPDDLSIHEITSRSSKVCGKHYQEIRKIINSYVREKGRAGEKKGGSQEESKKEGEEDREKTDNEERERNGKEERERNGKVEEKREESLIVLSQIPKRLKYDPLLRLKLAITALKGSSLNSSAELVAIGSASSFQDLKDLKFPSRQTTIQALCELYQCFQYHMAWCLSSSSELALIIDSTTDSHREVLAVLFAGLLNRETPWILSHGVTEIQGHKATSQVAIVRKILEKINYLQKRQGWKETRLYEVLSLTADNTGSNTGENGVRGILDKERKKEWEKDGKEGICPEMVFKGCQDHIVHLASKEFEERLMNRTLAWGMVHKVDHKRHVSASALCHIVARLRSNLFYRPFRAFVRQLGGKTPRFSRHTETRYASINLISLEFLRNERHALLFLRACRTLLTEEDLKALKV